MDFWSYVLTAVGVTGFYLAGRKVWWCWYINIANQILWTIYSITTQQWGFLFGVLVYLLVFVPNAIRWTKEHYLKKKWEERPIFAKDADVTVYWPDVRPDYDADHIKKGMVRLPGAVWPPKRKRANG
jgi:hypothetical protein